MSSDAIFELDGFPPLHGTLAKIAQWFMGSARRPHRESAYITALSYGSVVCARFFSFEESYSTSYFCISADTGVGKEDLRTAATKLSQSLGCMQLIMNVSSFTSDAGVHAAIVTQPQSLALIDEFGKVFEAMSSSVLNQTALTTLTIAFTTAHTALPPKGYADVGAAQTAAKYQTVQRPAMSLLVFGTPREITKNLTPDTFTSGEFSRFLFFEIPGDVVRPNPEYQPVPKDVIKALMDILRIHNSVNGELLIQGCDGIEAAIKCGIEPEIDTTEIDMRYQRERAATKDTTSKALITRRFEKAKRLAIIISLLGTDTQQNLKSPVISSAALNDALMIVEKSDKLVKSWIRNQSTYPDNYIELADQMAAYIDNELCGTSKLAVTQKELSDQFPEYAHKNTAARRDIWELLSDRGITVRQEGKGRTNAYFFEIYEKVGDVDDNIRIGESITAMKKGRV